MLGHEDAGAPAVYRNAGAKGAPKFVAAPPLAFPLPPSSAPAFADMNGDGVLDLFVGTTSGGLRFYRGKRDK